MKEPLVGGVLIVALLLANGLAASYPAPGLAQVGTRLPQPTALDRLQEEHLDQYTKLRLLLFEEYAASTALCMR